MFGSKNKIYFLNSIFDTLQNKPQMHPYGTGGIKLGFLTSLITIIFLFLKDKPIEEPKKEKIKENKFIYLNTKTINEIQRGRWILLVTNNNNNKWLKEAIKISNVALLKVDSFEQSKLAATFNVSKLPEIIKIEDGKIKNNKIEFDSIDFWRAVDIFFIVKYLGVIEYLKRISFKFIEERLNVFDLTFNIFPVFRSVVFYF